MTDPARRLDQLGDRHADSVPADDRTVGAILPLVAGEGDRRLLMEWIEDQTDYDVVDPARWTDGAQFDLCIVDSGGLREHGEALRARKQETEPVLLPVLLLLPDFETGVRNLELGELADGVLEATIDEVVSLPIRKLELGWRVEALLRLRAQSLELRARERELREFLRASEAAGHAVYITDPEGTIVYVNPAFERITGFEAGEAVGQTPRILRSGEMSEAHYRRLWETVMAGDVWDEEVINRRSNGDRYLAQQTIAPILSETGDIEALVAIQTDITDRKRLETELRESKERYESLFNSIRDAILVADTDGRIIDCNPAFTDLFGYELSEIEGDTASTLFETDAEYEATIDPLEDHYGDPGSLYTASYRKQSGQVFPGETNVFELEDANGEIQGFIGLVRDVSDRRDRIEQLQVIDRVLRHNLHNDMNVIRGYARNIEETGAPEAVEAAAKIIEAGDALLGTVDKEREITKLLSEPESRLPIDLAPLVSDTVAAAREAHPEARIDLEVEGCTVSAIPSIETALAELLENAITHAESREPSVSVAVECGEATGRIIVRDDGPGIPEMEQAVLTREAAIEPLFHGSGLGLWLVNLIVGQCDGVLEFADNEPRGSVVSIGLPYG